MDNQLKLKVESGGGNVTISNSKLEISFGSNGKATSLKLGGKEVLNNLQGEPGDPDKKNSFYCDYHMDGKTINLNPDQLKIIEDSRDRKHIAFIDNCGKLGLEYHIIINANDSGIYSYVKAWNNTSEVFPINELRTVYRTDHSLTCVGYNGIRTGLQPTSKDMMMGKKLQDETYLMKNGSLYDNSQIYSKYDYAGYLKDTNYWGQYGNDFGLWVIVPDKSSYGCGPLNQDLMVHYDGITLNYLDSEHFGKGLFYIPKNWHKLYGPWIVYLNDGNLEDVNERVNKDLNDWPYSWIKDPDYNQNLCRVSGTLNSEYSSDSYTIILTDKSVKDEPIHEQKSGYIYYTNTGSHGSFELKNVRPGHYWIYTYANNSEDLETHFLKELDVKSNTLLESFKIKRQSTTIWQIGKGTHTTEGFKFSRQLRNYCWQELVPDNLDYFVGQSRDWYYLQNDQGIWNIHFSNRGIDNNSNVELQLAFAGVTQKDMRDTRGTLISLRMNNSAEINKHFINDRAAYRSALQSGAYHLWKIEIPIDEIQENNTISISTNGYIMYDSIKLLQKKEGKKYE